MINYTELSSRSGSSNTARYCTSCTAGLGDHGLHDLSSRVEDNVDYRVQRTVRILLLRQTGPETFGGTSDESHVLGVVADDGADASDLLDNVSEIVDDLAG